MLSAGARRIMMISTHGYVSAEPQLGRRDTGGQVAYVLDLSRCLGELGFEVDIFTRRFEDQPALEQVTERVRIVGLPCGGDEFIPKEVLCDHIPQWVSDCARYIARHGLRYVRQSDPRHSRLTRRA